MSNIALSAVYMVYVNSNVLEESVRKYRGEKQILKWRNSTTNRQADERLDSQTDPQTHRHTDTPADIYRRI